MSNEGHVVVIGGGLSGLSAALSALDNGASVTLYEARPRLGGATWSFERNGLFFDNGQHVFLRCCSAYRRFLERIGSSDQVKLQEKLRLPVIRPNSDPEKSTCYLERGRLPGKLSLLPSLLGYRHLSLGDRLRTLYGLALIAKLAPSDPALDEESLASYLSRHGQTTTSTAGLFELITLPTVNLHASDASLQLAVRVFRTGLLDDPSGADLGWAQVPLSKLHVEPAVAALEKAGGTVHTGAKITEIALEPRRRRAVGVRLDGEIVEADAVVLAVPHDVAGELVPAGSRIHPALLEQLSFSPIIDVHLVYNKKVMSHEVAAAVDSPVQFIFDRTQAAGLKGEGQCLAVSVSAADSEHGERPEILIDRYERAVSELFPAARGAKLVDAVVSREHRATFRGTPGTAKLRAATDIGFENLFLAGAWTDTGWPATMEGAVRSGVRAGRRAVLAARTTRGHSSREAVA